MKIKITRAVPVAPDGVNVISASPGEEYDWPDDLVDSLVNSGHGEYVKKTAEIETPESQAGKARGKRGK